MKTCLCSTGMCMKDLVKRALALISIVNFSKVSDTPKTPLCQCLYNEKNGKNHAILSYKIQAL